MELGGEMHTYSCTRNPKERNFLNKSDIYYGAKHVEDEEAENKLRSILYWIEQMIKKNMLRVWQCVQIQEHPTSEKEGGKRWHMSYEILLLEVETGVFEKCLNVWK